MEEKKPKKILIIEDEQELISSLATLLKSQGYLTAGAYDSLYGISLAHKGDVDLIILDLGLPAGGGLYVLENLKKSVQTNLIPVLVLTARQEKELEEKAYQMGVEAYLRKPFDPKELLDKIKEILEAK
jgi:DNA-binding response OmpR family regulator